MARSKTSIAYSVCRSDLFQELSFEAQALYQALNLESDGYGTVANYRSVMRAGSFSREAFDELVAGGFINMLETDVSPAALIVHFWVANNNDATKMGRCDVLPYLDVQYEIAATGMRRYIPAGSGNGIPIVEAIRDTTENRKDGKVSGPDQNRTGTGPEPDPNGTLKQNNPKETRTEKAKAKETMGDETKGGGIKEGEGEGGTAPRHPEDYHEGCGGFLDVKENGQRFCTQCGEIVPLYAV